jgi:hypothetical protein
LLPEIKEGYFPNIPPIYDSATLADIPGSYWLNFWFQRISNGSVHTKVLQNPPEDQKYSEY